MTRFFFGTARRVWLSFFVGQLIFQIGGYALQRYILDVCNDPGLALLLLAGWFILGVFAGFVSGVLLAYFSGGAVFLAELTRDEMAEFDARIDGRVLPDSPDEDDEAVMIQRIRGGGKLVLYWVLGLVVTLVSANAIGGQFLQTFSHPGLAVIQLRSDDSNARRRGIEALLLRGTEDRSEMITNVVRKALSDSSEGVVARAIHVAGQLSLSELLPELSKFTEEHSVFTFSTLISLGLMTEQDRLGNTRPDSASRRFVAKLFQNEAALKEPEALAYASGLLKVTAFEGLRNIYENAKDERERLASVWALAQLKDSRLVSFFQRALGDDSLQVQCAAVNALEHLALPESAPFLMQRFEALVGCVGEGEARSCEPLAPLTCPEVALPVQEGGATRIVLKRREFLLAIVRALSATEHPKLLTWLVRFQLKSETNYRTWLLMSKVYAHMEELDRRGTLSTIRQRLRQTELLRMNRPLPKVQASPKEAERGQ